MRAKVGEYMVVCRDDSTQDPAGEWHKGKFRLAGGASRGEAFATLSEAKAYASGVNSSREPLIVMIVNDE